MANPTAGPTGPAQSLVATFTGPKEGVGKSVLCLNTSLAWAAHRNKNVLIVQLDPLCRNEHGYYLGLQPPSVADLIQWVGGSGQSASSISRLLKGKIPISSYGVGTLALANRRADVSKISPEILLSMLAGLSETYDIFLDIDPFFPMQVFSFDISDCVFWVTLPHLSHFQATAKLFNEIKELHFPIDRFEVVVNQADLPGSIAPKEAERFFASLQKNVLTSLPWDEFILENSNSQRILVVERPQSDWAKGLRVVLGRLATAKPMERTWSLSVSGEEFGQGADLLWKSDAAMMPAGPAAPAGGHGPSATATPAKPGQPSPRADGLPENWDDLKTKIHKLIVAGLETERVHISDDAAKNAEVRKKVEGIAENILNREPNINFSREQRTKFINELLDEILGLGPLEELMRNPAISEIMVNGPHHLYIEQGGKLVLTQYRFRDDEQVLGVIKRIVAPYNRRIDESVPLVDCRLKDGSRVNAIIPPLAVSGPTITIRRFSSRPLMAKDLTSKGALTDDMVTFAKNCVVVRKNIIISGGTGTGKTTFLNMLSNYIPDDERIITVEDTAELKLLKEHWVRLESRPANIEGKGEVTIRDLVKNCLRMRPDRIVVGECRGSEALDMLQAMNTGHEGSLATIHANTPKDALGRLEAMCLMAGADLPIWALREMICSAVHMFVQLTRFADGTRKITYITEVTGREEQTILTHDLFRFHQTGVTPEGKVLGEFKATGDPPKFYHEFKEKGLDVPIETFWTPEQKRARQGAAPQVNVKV